MKVIAIMIYYFYKITNNINGKFYYGVHATKEGRKDRYMGSGKYLQKAQKLYGLRHFSKEILKYFSSEEEMYEYEASFVNKQFLLENAGQCYNLICGGRGGAAGSVFMEKDGKFIRVLPELVSQLESEGWILRGTSKGKVCIKSPEGKVSYVDPLKVSTLLAAGWKQEGGSAGLCRVEKDTEQRFVPKVKLQEYLDAGWVLGTGDRKKQQQSQALRGRIHICRGSEGKMIQAKELKQWELQGWVRGRNIDEHLYADKISKALQGKQRTEEQKEKYRKAKTGYRYMNNGEKNKQVKPEDFNKYLDLGWVWGMKKS